MDGQDAAVKAVGVPLVHHEVVEVRLQAARRPALFDFPSRGPLTHGEAADAQPAHGVCRGREDVPVGGCCRLHHGSPLPLILPEDLAIGRCDTRGAFTSQEQNLWHAVDRHQMWRAVAAAGRFDHPALIAFRSVVGHEGARGGDNHQVVDDQR